MPPNFCTSSVASSWTTSTTSSTVTMPFIRPSSSTTGTAIRSWLETRRDTCSWSMSSGTVTRSERITSRTRRSPEVREQLAEGNHPEQVLLGVEDVDVVDGLELVAGLAAEVADRLVDRHVRPDAGEARAHQAAGVVLGVGHQGAHLAAGGVVEQREELVPTLLRDLLEDVDRVVGGEGA